MLYLILGAQLVITSVSLAAYLVWNRVGTRRLLVGLTGCCLEGVKRRKDRHSNGMTRLEQGTPLCSIDGWWVKRDGRLDPPIYACVLTLLPCTKYGPNSSGATRSITSASSRSRARTPSTRPTAGRPPSRRPSGCVSPNEKPCSMNDHQRGLRLIRSPF